jgi:hypothetical protein
MSTHVEIDGHTAACAAGPRRPGRALGSALLLVSVALLVGLAAGCGGGGGSPNVANIGSSTTTGGSTAGSPAAGASDGTPPASSSAPPAGGGEQLAIAGGGQKIAQFAACMRTHGVPNFYPNAQGVISASPSNGVDPGSPQFQHARQACAKDLPNGGTPSPAQVQEMRSQALAFSACMRKHGEPNFPDPNFLGGGAHVAIRIGSGSGIDPHSTQFQHATQACQSILPGRLGKPTLATSGAIGGK